MSVLQICIAQILSMSKMLLLAGILLQAVACTSLSSVDDTLSVRLSEDTVRPAHTDVYPGFSKPLTAAMAQMSNEEATGISAELEALNKGRQNGFLSEADYWRRVRDLELLATKHSVDALTQIEKPQ